MGRILFEQLHDQCTQFGGHGFWQWWNLLVHMRESDIHLRRPGKGTLSGKGLVSDDSQGVQVSGGSRRIARSLLRGQVLGCSHDHAHRGQLFLMRAKRNAEIGKLGDSIRTHQNIRRFDVAVNNPRAMDGVQSIGGLVHDRQQQIQLQSSAILQ